MSTQFFDILRLSILVLASVQTTQTFQPSLVYNSLKSKCKYVSDKLADVDTPELEYVGSKGTYYEHPKDTNVPDYSNRMYRVSAIDEYTENMIKMTQALSNSGLGPQYHGCQVVVCDNDEFEIYVVLDRLETISEQRKKLRQDNLNKPLAFLKFLIESYLPLYNAGYYHNSIKMKTVGFTKTMEMKFLEPDFTVVKTPKVVVSKPLGSVSNLDAPTLTLTNSLQRTTDDLYSIVLMFFFIMLEGNYDKYMLMPANKTKNKKEKDCFFTKDEECIKYIAESVTEGLFRVGINSKKGVYSEYQPEYSKSKYGKISTGDNFEESLKELGGMKVNTFIQDFLYYKSFPLNLDQTVGVFKLFLKDRLVI